MKVSIKSFCFHEFFRHQKIHRVTLVWALGQLCEKLCSVQNASLYKFVGAGTKSSSKYVLSGSNIESEARPQFYIQLDVIPMYIFSWTETNSRSVV